MKDDGGRSLLGFPALFTSPLFHSGRQPSNSQSESKATAEGTINFGESSPFRSGSHFGEEQLSYNGILLVVLLLCYPWFDRTSLAAGTFFALTSALLLLIYAVFGSLYLGDEFAPPIKDLPTAFYYSIVTMSTVGYGDISPKSVHARLFAVSIMVFGLTLFATSITAIAGPLITRLSAPKEKRMKRTNHFIVIGATPLAYNTYHEFKRRNQPTVLVLPQEPTATDIDPNDVIVGDPNNLETLRRAGVSQA